MQLSEQKAKKTERAKAWRRRVVLCYENRTEATTTYSGDRGKEQQR